MGEAFARVRRDLGLRLTVADGNHTNHLGALVASCVLYTTLTERRCLEGADLIDLEVAPDVAAQVRALLARQRWPQRE